jgi:protein ImuB
VRDLDEPNVMGRYAMKRPAELYACIYVREFPAQAVLRLRPDLKDCACVVMEGELPFEQVCSLNTKARLLGVQTGMRRTDVDGFPQAKIFTRSLKTESAAGEMLLECAGIYSPRIEERSGTTYFLCAIDIAGTEYLFGSPETLAARLLQHVRLLGLSARVIVSSNFHTAACLAKSSSGRSVAVVRCGEESVALSTLPLDVLPITQQQAEIFALWGIKTLGMLAAIPDTELIARIGQDGRHLQQLTRGELPHLFQPVEPPLTLEEQQELDFPIESIDSLMFGLAVMLDHLILRATARLVSLAAVTLILELDGGTTHTRTVRPAQPGNDKTFWIRLLHLDLQAHPPQAAVLGVGLKADPGNTSKLQLGLFSPPLPETARLDVTLAQLKALLGEQNVGRPILLDSHARESYQVEPFAILPNGCASAIAQRQQPSTRQLRPPQTISISLQDSQPRIFSFSEQRFVVQHAYGPWAAGGEWWNEERWNIEQWDVIAKTSAGSVLYCCLAHDRLRNQWQITALYD